MSESEQRFFAIGQSLPNSDASQMFGKKSFKTNGKAYICFFQDCMVFKLTAPDHATALALPNAKLFDPSGKGRAMKEWVQLPYETNEHWNGFAKSALEYCAGQ